MGQRWRANRARGARAVPNSAAIETVGQGVQTGSSRRPGRPDAKAMRRLGRVLRANRRGSRHVAAPGGRARLRQAAVRPRRGAGRGGCWLSGPVRRRRRSCSDAKRTTNSNYGLLTRRVGSAHPGASSTASSGRPERSWSRRGARRPRGAVWPRAGRPPRAARRRGRRGPRGAARGELARRAATLAAANINWVAPVVVLWCEFPAQVAEHGGVTYVRVHGWPRGSSRSPRA